ncbi:MAG: amino acid permease, partial [Anaerolineae bacterium]|nr:amino acid permease [Anaerolineae bacterium]
SDIWPGVLLALLVAFLTISGFSELVYRYPLAGSRSAYHFAQSVFEEFTSAGSPFWSRPAKLVTGWAAHLFYWVYPGVLVAFMATLFDYLARQLGYHPTLFGQVLLAFAFAAFIGFLALRGITGSTTSSIILNIIQITTLVIFGGLAIVFRLANINTLAPQTWQFTSLSDIIIPRSLNGVVFQAAIAFFLVSGFEATAALGAYSANPGRDISRGAFLALMIQGVVSYLFQYLAINLALNSSFFNGAAPLQAAAMSSAPLGDIAIKIGDGLLWNNGFALMIVIASAVVISIMAAMLTAINNGVRVSFAMALDAEMPGIMGSLHPRYATPYVAVVLISLVSAVIGSIGVMGGAAALLGFTLAANLGAFALYAIICILAVLPTPYTRTSLKRALPALLGAVVNVGMLVSTLFIGLRLEGIALQATWLAIIVAVFYFAVSLLVFLLRRKQA